MKRITFATTVSAIAAICFFVIILSAKHCDECFSPPVMAMKFLICGLIIIVGSIYYKTQYLELENVMFNLESEPIREVEEAVDGVPFAGQGTIETDDNKIIISPFTNTQCVYYHSILEEYINQGKNSHWMIKENRSDYLPFYLKDKTGRLRIDMRDMDSDFSQYDLKIFGNEIHKRSIPINSEVDCERLLFRYEYNEKEQGPFGIGINKRFRKTEFVLRPGTQIFAYGMVLKDDNGLMLHETESIPLIISRKNRDKYVLEFYEGSNLIYLAHLLVAFGFSVFLLSLNYFVHLYPQTLTIYLLIGNIAITGSIIFTLYNRIVTLKQRALNALSNIEIDLKRRNDLITNLVEAVKGYNKHEKEIQELVAEARTQIVFSKQILREAQPIIPALVAIIENYPDLKASENFLSLMRMLVDIEERIAYAREFYNRSVRKYNTLVAQLPFALVASPLGMKEMEFISIGRG